MNNGQIVSQDAIKNQAAAVAVGRPAANSRLGALNAALGEVSSEANAKRAPAAGASKQELLNGLYGAPFVAVCLDAAAAARVSALGVACLLANQRDSSDPWAWIGKESARAERRARLLPGHQEPTPALISQMDPDLPLSNGLLKATAGRSVLVIARADSATSEDERSQARVAAHTLAQALVISSGAVDVRVLVDDTMEDALFQLTEADNGSFETMLEDLPFENAALSAEQAKGIADAKASGRLRLDVARLAPGFDDIARLGSAPGELSNLQGAVKQTPVAPVYRKMVPYTQARFEDEDGKASMRTLHIRLPFQRGRDTFNPQWEWEQVIVRRVPRGKEAGGGFDEVSVVEWRQVPGPYLWLDHTLQIAEPQEGVLQLNNPLMPIMLSGVYKGRSDDLRSPTLNLHAEVTLGELARLGFACDKKAFERWVEAQKAIRGQNACKSKLATRARGWIGAPDENGCVPDGARHYVLGSRVIAPQGARELVSLDANDAAMGLTKAGTMAGWTKMASLAMRNPAIATLMGVAAASALLGIVGTFEPVIVHLINASGAGKSAILSTIASMIGSAAAPRDTHLNPYIKAWSTTTNGIAAPLAQSTNAPFLRDELGQLEDASHLEAMLYAIANGSEKQRMTREGAARKALSWMVNMISTGELGMAAKMAKSARPGQQGIDGLPGGLLFRVVEITMDKERSLWAFAENEAQKEDFGIYGEQVARHHSSSTTPEGIVVDSVVSEAMAHHGHFWEEWIRFLQTSEGMARVHGWQAEISAQISALAQAGDARVAQRRGKHVIAALTGLRGVLEICRFPQAFADEIFENAKKWAVEDFWHAGLESRSESEGDRTIERAHGWLLSNEARFFESGGFIEPKDSIGWRNLKTGMCVLTSGGQEALAKALGEDMKRLSNAMVAAGWKKAQGRHPRQGRTSSPLKVLKLDGFFYSGEAESADERSKDEASGKASERGAKGEK